MGLFFAFSPTIQLLILFVTVVPVLLIKRLEEQMGYREETWDTPSTKAIIFPDPQTAVDDLLDDWLPRLIESNEIVTAALLSIKGLCSVDSSSVVAEGVLAEVDAALKRATRAKGRLLANSTIERLGLRISPYCACLQLSLTMNMRSV
jgi:hypothetical protein